MTRHGALVMTVMAYYASSRNFRNPESAADHFHGVKVISAHPPFVVWSCYEHLGLRLGLR